MMLACRCHELLAEIDRNDLCIRRCREIRCCIAHAASDLKNSARAQSGDLRHEPVVAPTHAQGSGADLGIDLVETLFVLHYDFRHWDSWSFVAWTP